MVSHSCGITDYIRLLYKATIYHLFIDNHSGRLFRLKLVYLYEPDNGRLSLCTFVPEYVQIVPLRFITLCGCKSFNPEECSCRLQKFPE